MKNQLSIDHIILEVLQNSASKDELKFFNTWLQEKPSHHKIYQNLSQEWNRRSIPRKAINEQDMIDKIWDQQKTSTRIFSRGGKKYRFFNFAKVAAVLVLAILFYFMYTWQQEQTSVDEVVSAVIEKQNISGQKSKVHLSDGTTVWLNANSTLSYPKPFEGHSRRVELTGEGYFEVAKDASRPFLVSFGNITVEALGTSFNITAFEDDKSNLVALTAGKIKVTYAGQNEVLTEGWIAKIDKSSAQLTRYEGDVMAYKSWTQDILLFKDASFDEILPKLERWYGVEIIVDGHPDPTKKFNGTFESEYLENVLENLTIGDEMTYAIEDQKVYVKFK